MKKILLVHGPNLNNLGKRKVGHYGNLILPDIVKLVGDKAKEKDYQLSSFQSNHEGDLIDFLQKESSEAVGIIINPGALTHYSYALYDSLLDTGLPCVEVHLSDINNREDFRKKSVTKPACIGQIMGEKEQGYIKALELLLNTIK